MSTSEPSASSDASPAGDTYPPLADCILVVEDNEDDVILFQRLVRRASATTALDVVTDGETAIGWLTERLAASERGKSALPRAIFIDLNLPGMAGAEVLRWVRTQAALDRAMVVVCSGSNDVCDIAEAERRGADLYLTKYPTVEQLKALLSVRDPRLLRDTTELRVR